ncbi:MAG: ribonuclease P [Nanoarchaeota archaeon]|nr:ribonuclease P [Nanoarchaeota archaeon]|tara:strand:- start:4978 stop:5289 length:312 start_codon:yes stop_codon:yes gene_type:complete
MKNSVQKQKDIARKRIKELFLQASKVFKEDQKLAHRYVTLARKLSMKARVRMPREYKRQFCKHCYKYLVSGTNARIRTKDGKVVISCFECKKFTRIPITKSKK